MTCLIQCHSQRGNVGSESEWLAPSSQLVVWGWRQKPKDQRDFCVRTATPTLGDAGNSVLLSEVFASMPCLTSASSLVPELPLPMLCNRPVFIHLFLCFVSPCKAHP